MSWLSVIETIIQTCRFRNKSTQTFYNILYDISFIDILALHSSHWHIHKQMREITICVEWNEQYIVLWLNHVSSSSRDLLHHRKDKIIMNYIPVPMHFRFTHYICNTIVISFLIFILSFWIIFFFCKTAFPSNGFKEIIELVNKSGSNSPIHSILLLMIMDSKPKNSKWRQQYGVDF